MRFQTIRVAILAACLSGLPFTSLAGQGQSIFVLTGYGDATYEAAATSDYPNDFSASVSPIFLFTMGGNILFEAELEFGLSGAATTTGLGYAQIDYLGFESVQIIAGKFLLPFGIFGERQHPTWINKLPTAPVLYGHAHGGVAEGALLPIMSDAGVMMRWAKPFASKWALDFSAYVTQGPRIATEEAAGDDGHDDVHASLQASLISSEPEHGDAVPAPPVAFGTSFADNNKNKMLGARIGLVKGPSFEVYASGFHAMYDEGNFLDFKGGALSLEWRRGGFEFRTEGVITRQEFEGDDHFETLNRGGFYAQASKKVGQWEPVVRWGRLVDSTVDGVEVIEGHNEVAFGLNFWLEPTVPVKFAYEFHQGRDDRLYIQWAYGF